MQKILIIRFSSIGDVVLTTPLIRCIHKQLKHAEVHYVTRDSFKCILENSPYIFKIHTFKEDISEVYMSLKAENFDVIIDLHKNLRSFRLKLKLKIKSFSFNKINIEKFLAVNFKLLNKLPPVHIVDRYFEAINTIGVVNDNEGLDYFLSEVDKINTKELFFNNVETKFIALVVGGSYYTKKIPLDKLVEICSLAKLSIVLMGGKEDIEIGTELQKRFPKLINTCGQFSINQSASIVKQSEWVITSDTGLMHIASAFKKKIISIWGNTIPEFGMGPYLPVIGSKVLEVQGLKCRPCSKLGYKKCPLTHFKCMNEQDVSILSDLS